MKIPSVEADESSSEKSYLRVYSCSGMLRILLTETKVFRSFWMLSSSIMPAPTDIPPIKGVDLDGNEVVRHSSDEEPFSALAFKIMTDPFVGKLAYFRVYSGTHEFRFLCTQCY